MRKIQLAFTALLLGAAQIGSATVIDIPDGDISEAHRALCLAAGRERPVTLRLAYRGHYDFSHLTTTDPAEAEAAKIHGGSNFCTRDESGVIAPQRIAGKVVFEGRGSTITGFNLTISGDLTVRDASFVGAENHFYVNDGKLVLERVGIVGGMRDPLGNIRRVPMIENRGELVLKNATVADILYGGPCTPGAAALANHGTARINNSTFHANRIRSFECAAMSADIWTASDATTIVSNSIIGSTGPDPRKLACLGPLQSRGNNFAVEGRCTQLDAASDGLVSLFPSPLRMRLLSHRYAVTPLADSPTVNSRPAASTGIPDCEATDQRGFLRDALVTGACDAGAIELDAVPVIDPARIAGYWFDPAHDGIYVHVNLLSPSKAYLLFQGFDDQGAPAWYYGTGTPGEDRLTVTLFRNDGLSISNGMVAGNVEAVAVGEATFTLHGCRSASFEFDIAERGIGSGSLDMDRLTFTEGLECIDRR